MNSFKLVALLLQLVVFSKCEIVEIEDGKINGTTMQSRLGETFFAFHRIPYAAAPTGNLRFRDPVVNAPWTDVLDGTTFGPLCYQANPRPDFEMSEDCLRLNVFTKNLAASKPVIVYVHGGGFVQGSANDQGGPRNLMDRDIVLVTFNYRLGALGFLAIGTKEIPGNAALKDQVFALRWVQKNIAKFGGDPNSVTVSGQSAGAFATTALLVSPMAKGLFHKIIGMSGSISTVEPYQADNYEIAQKVSTEVGCRMTGFDDEQLKCLIEKPPLDFVTINLASYPECEIKIWMPVVEADFGQERFFSEDPLKQLNNGNFTKVPVMIGRTADEFVDVVERLLASERFNDFQSNFQTWAPFCFFYHNYGNRSRLTQALRSSYLPYETIDVRSFSALNNLFADSYIGYPVHKLVHQMSNFTDVFYYKFTFIGRFSIYLSGGSPYGVHHVDDLQYVFDVDFIGPLLMPTDPEGFMVDRMTRIWEHFAWNGNPNYDTNLINWSPHNAASENFMEIGLHLVEKHGMFLERYAVWENATAIYSSTSLTTSLTLTTMVVLVLLLKYI